MTLLCESPVDEGLCGDETGDTDARSFYMAAQRRQGPRVDALRTAGVTASKCRTGVVLPLLHLLLFTELSYIYGWSNRKHA